MILLEHPFRLKEQVASGDRPPYSAVFEIPGVFSQDASLRVVAVGAAHHQNCFILHHLGHSERGK